MNKLICLILVTVFFWVYACSVYNFEHKANPVLILDNEDPTRVGNWKFFDDLADAIVEAGIEEPYRVIYIWIHPDGDYSLNWAPGAAIWSAHIYKEE